MDEGEIDWGVTTWDGAGIKFRDFWDVVDPAILDTLLCFGKSTGRVLGLGGIPKEPVTTTKKVGLKD